MKPCPSCGQSLAGNAPRCPKCGHDFANRRNIRAILILLGLILALMILGGIGECVCGQEDHSSFGPAVPK